ncbi:MAG: helicase [Candidatus Margulisbacteria bacterium GWF2_35_9]|nr:MAG: helicase [Candidatus Margulisbacteria bacterium GWF2_35_9]
MNYDDLYKKYQELLSENKRLKKENSELKKKLKNSPLDEGINSTLDDISNSPIVNNNSSDEEKINLFQSLFKGRSDVFAKRWVNKAGKSGYSPVCVNEWKRSVCFKPRIKCSNCANKNYLPLDSPVIQKHLTGEITVGLYPMLEDEACYFLAIDFDDTGWQSDVSAVRKTCFEYNIPSGIERSRSGDGAHLWFFFQEKIPAYVARKLGTALITSTMNQRHELSFSSYDRLFPSQDTLPTGGFGNLIALPLQHQPRQKENSLFIDDVFNPYPDQWAFLSLIEKLSTEQIELLIKQLCKGSELGDLRKNDEESTASPWKTQKLNYRLVMDDAPSHINVVRADMLYIEKEGISQKALNQLKRVAAFKNPEFYKAQAMRMPTYNKPRIISCSNELDKYLCLPRGCESEMEKLLAEIGSTVNWQDETNIGRSIKVVFNGNLRAEQQIAATALLKNDIGVLSATTAFGKTVIAASLISEHKVNTLIIVHRQQLLTQWIDRLKTFLVVDEEAPFRETKTGRKKPLDVIGQLGAGKNRLSGIIDVAIMQSLNISGEVKDCIKEYGMVIIDECHHIPAFSFEQVLKKAKAKYIYGLTATPKRQDGHHPIIFFYCGSIQYQVDAKKQAEKRPFDHYVIPRFTRFRLPLGIEEKKLNFQEIYSEIVTNELRNQLIVDDIIKANQSGRNSLILTERTSHVEILANKLSKKIDNVKVLTGSTGTKETLQIIKEIELTPIDKAITIVATGKYIGEGFDAPKLDTLFLAMPISWKGTLHQYVGRLHRLYEGKQEVQVYDYVDIHIKVLEKMYGKRLMGYASLGYKSKGASMSIEDANIIFNKSTFYPVFINDINVSNKRVLIVSPLVTKNRVAQFLPIFSTLLEKGVQVAIITRPKENYSEKRREGVQTIFNIIQKADIDLIFQDKLHQRCAIMDQHIVWYGNINLLSYGLNEESIMRLKSYDIAAELVESLDN